MKNTRRFFLTAVMLLVARGCLAYDFQSGGIYYNIRSNTAPYTVVVTSYDGGIYNLYSGSVTIPSSVTWTNKTYSVVSIGSDAFRNSTGMTSVTIPNTVTGIGSTAFSGCVGLTTITIPNSVTSLGNFAFQLCTRLDSVYMGNSVTSIGYGAFYCCTSLRNINIPNSVTSIGPVAFSGDTSLISINIPNTVTSIGNGAFGGCTNLSSILIPNSITSLENSVFGGCSSLTSVAIPDAVTSIGQQVFYNCTDLTSVTIGNSVANIGYLAFGNCSSLDTIVFTSQNPPTIDTSSFRNVPSSVVVVVPCGSRSAYMAVLGNVFPNIVQNATFPFVVSLHSNDTLKGNVRMDSIPSCVNTQATFSAVANYGFHFSLWNDGDRNNPRTITVIRDTNFTAIFDTNVYFVNISSFDTSMGIVSGGGRYNYMSQATLTAVVNQGYAFSHWSDGDTNLQRIITVTQDTTLVAYFTANAQQWYRFSVVSEDTLKGTIQIITQPTQSSPQATFVALPNTGYTFSRWSDGNTQNPRTLTVTQDTSLVAFFSGSAPQWYRFNVVSEDTLKGTVQILAQPTQSSPQATFVALPNTGYTFSRWSDGNTQNPRTLTVTQDTVLVACFTSSSPQWYNFNVVSEDVNKGTVQILAQPSLSNPQATFEAVPNHGYTFSRWSDGSTRIRRSITVTQDTILIAFFTSNQGIAEVESASITLYPNPASEKVTLEGIGNETNVFVINTMGKIVKRLENTSGSVIFSVADLPKGIYFVRVGSAVRKLVVE